MDLVRRIKGKEAVVGVIGLGYVGLPLALEFLKAGFRVMGFDSDEEKVRLLEAGKSYIAHIDSATLRSFQPPKFLPTTDFAKIAGADCIIMCLPTPLGAHNEPDMSYVFDTAETIARHLRKGQLVVLESTTYPGTTDQDLRGILERSGLRAGVDFHLAYSPEREDPSMTFDRRYIPKVVGGYTLACLEAASALYGQIVEKTVPVSSTRVAESAKLLENIYRAVNIALINEMKMLFDRMGIDVWEVIEAAKTKPFGFTPFYPGPGMGGHCIPIDPFYLTWKAREYDFTTGFINLAGEINTRMPYYVVEKAREALNAEGKPFKGARIIVLGVAYKKDVGDQRESASLKIMALLMERGAEVFYHDPHVPRLKGLRHYPGLDISSVELSSGLLQKCDLVILATDHSAFDYPFIEKHSRLILDTRNAFRANGIQSAKVLRA